MTEPHFGYGDKQIAHAVSLDTHATRFVAASAANHVKLSDPVNIGDAVADLAHANG